MNSVISTPSASPPILGEAAGGVDIRELHLEKNNAPKTFHPR